MLDCPYSTKNPIKVSIPELFWLDGGLLNIPGDRTRVGFDVHWFYNLLNIWSTNYIVRSLESSSNTRVFRIWLLLIIFFRLFFFFLFFRSYTPRAACSSDRWVP